MAPRPQLRWAGPWVPGKGGAGAMLCGLRVSLGPWAGERVLEAWGSGTRLAGNVGDWRGTAFLSLHNEILMTDPFS